MSSTFEKEAREVALEMALDLQNQRQGDNEVSTRELTTKEITSKSVSTKAVNTKVVNAALVVADATIFYRFLTQIPEGFAPASGEKVGSPAYC